MGRRNTRQRRRLGPRVGTIRESVPPVLVASATLPQFDPLASTPRAEQPAPPPAASRRCSSSEHRAKPVLDLLARCGTSRGDLIFGEAQVAPQLRFFQQRL